MTVMRSKAIRFCRLDQIEGDVWTVPADNMKGLRGRTTDFRVPLSSEAISVIKRARAFAKDGFLFPSIRRGVISDATMNRYMERAGLKARPHGFRSSFRTWCAEATDTPRDVAESALAHSTGTSVERAYRRTDFLDRRREVMDRWGQFVCGTDAGSEAKPSVLHSDT